jgi:hypothetical protein
VSVPSASRLPRRTASRVAAGAVVRDQHREIAADLREYWRVCAASHACNMASLTAASFEHLRIDDRASPIDRLGFMPTIFIATLSRYVCAFEVAHCSSADSADSNRARLPSYSLARFESEPQPRSQTNAMCDRWCPRIRTFGKRCLLFFAKLANFSAVRGRRTRELLH